MRQPPYLLDERRRALVLGAIVDVCTYRDWTLHAAHVRTNHIHAVITADQGADSIAHDLKAYASRKLNCESIDIPGRKRWTRHASTRRIPDGPARDNAVHYVAGQGDPMALYVAHSR
jgi:REP element-mobilizing transposase RayT